MINTIAQEHIYKIIKSNLPIGFSVVDKVGTIIDFNSAAEMITGFTKSEAIGKSHFRSWLKTHN